MKIRVRVCKCGHNASTHLYEGIGRCVLPACGCRVFRRDVAK